MSIKNFMIFVTGAAVGSVCTYFVIRDKFAKDAENEIEEARKSFYRLSEKYNRNDEKEDDSDHKEKSIDMDKMKTICSEHKYMDYSKISEPTIIMEEKEELPNFDNKTTIIDPEIFADEPDYDIFTLTYYTGGEEPVLADEDDSRFDIIDKIPEDYEKHFGEYEADAVYIKDDIHKSYYEILKDSRNYKEIITSFGKVSDLEEDE